MKTFVYTLLSVAAAAATMNLAVAMDSNPIKDCPAEVQERIATYHANGLNDYQVSEALVADAYEGKEFTLCVMPKDTHDASATTWATCGEKQCDAKYKGRFAHVKNEPPKN